MGLWGDFGVIQGDSESPEMVSLTGHVAKLGDVSTHKHVWMLDIKCMC